MKEKPAMKEMNAPLPSTSPALPVVWVGECPAAGHPRQRPGCSAGPACGWTPHRGGPASFSLFSPVRPPVLSQSVTDARPVRCAESPPGTDGICHRVSTGHGGTGGILCARGHADLKQEIDKNTTVQKYNCTNVQTNKRTKVQKYKSTKVHSPHQRNRRAGRPSKGTLAGFGRGTISPSFTERFGKVARFAYFRGV